MTTQGLQKQLDYEMNAHIDTRILLNNISIQKREVEESLNKAFKEIERLTNLIPISWYDGYCKSGEKELAYDLLEKFKKENKL